MRTIEKIPFFIKRNVVLQREPSSSKSLRGMEVRTELPFGSRLQIPVYRIDRLRNVRNTMTQYSERKTTIEEDPRRPGVYKNKDDFYAAQKNDEK